MTNVRCLPALLMLAACGQTASPAVDASVADEAAGAADATTDSPADSEPEAPEAALDAPCEAPITNPYMCSDCDVRNPSPAQVESCCGGRRCEGTCTDAGQCLCGDVDGGCEFLVCCGNACLTYHQCFPGK